MSAAKLEASLSSSRRQSVENFEFPRDAEGKISWDVLGKLLTARLLEQVVYAAHVDRKHTDKNLTESFRPDTEWEYCYEKNGVVVLRKKTQQTCFMGRGVINKPMALVAEFMKDIQSSFIWDNLLVEARYVKTLQESSEVSDYIGYQLFETVQRCGLINIRRDLLYFTRCVFTEGKYVHSAVSVEDPAYPPNPNIPRMTLHMGSGFVAEPYHDDPEGKTLLSYIAHIDTKGIPSIVNSQVLKRHPMAVSKIRRSLEGSRRGEQSPLSSPPSSLPSSPLSSYSHKFEEGMNAQHFMRDDSLT